MAIRTIYDHLIQNTDQNLYSCCIFIDLSKAFDTVDHKILLNKMKSNFGIRGVALNLFASYLSNRRQYTKIRNENSNLHKITFGVPQGSSLGPILFLLYINEMPLVTKFDITLFADDRPMHLSLADKNLSSLEHRLNEELSIQKWMVL